MIQPRMIKILGISALYHDSAACLLIDGRIVAAVQEERFSRLKHDSSFPENAIKACLRIGACEVSEIDYLVFYEKPFTKFERLLETYLDNPHTRRSRSERISGAGRRGALRYYTAVAALGVRHGLWRRALGKLSGGHQQ